VPQDRRTENDVRETDAQVGRHDAPTLRSRRSVEEGLAERGGRVGVVVEGAGLAVGEELRAIVDEEEPGVARDLRGGRLDDALVIYRETILAWVHLGHRGAVANQLENVAYLLVERDEPVPAARLLAAAAAIREAANAQMAFDEEPEYAAAVDGVRETMGEAAFDAAWSAGSAMPQADAVALAVAS